MNVTTLQLVLEAKLATLMSGSDPDERWEASGLLTRDGAHLVVCDNRTEIVSIADGLVPGDANLLLGGMGSEPGFEGIAHNTRNGRYYLLIEARKDKRGRYRPMIVEYDERFEYVKSRPMDFEFESANRGFEAIAYVRRDSRDHLLGLCEGNKCQCGKAGRTPGGGRIQVFEKTKKLWSHVAAIKLPRSVQFKDYAGMSIADGRVAVVSQENSMLWVGEFVEAEWGWRDEGRLFEFPRTDAGEILYGNVEGVAWMGPDRVAVGTSR